MAPNGLPVVTSCGDKVLNAKGIQLLGAGRWHNCEVLDQFAACMGHVHCNAHQMPTNYVDKCEACFQQYKKQGFGGCVHHSLPRYTRVGNVASTNLFKDTITHIKNQSAHVVKGACHLLPSDVRTIRNWVHANNSLFGMEIYTLLLTSIELFLRKVEYSSLVGENFNTGLFLLTDKYVPEALNLSVKGKKTNTKEKKDSDAFAHWRKVWIFGDDECPDVDLKRHLLAFLYAIKWKGGYLFPSRKELENPPSDGIYRTHVTEDDLMTTLKIMFKDVLKRHDKLASHTGRKTGYLWGRIRGGAIEACMQAADHALFDTAKKYAKDADAMADLLKRAPCPEERLGQFHSCYCAPYSETSLRVTRRHKQWQCPLDELVIGFMEERVGINRNDERARHPTYILDAIVKWNKPQSPHLELRGHLKDISEDKSHLIMNCVNSIRGQTLRQARAEFNEKLEQRVEASVKAQLDAFEAFLGAGTAGDCSQSDEEEKYSKADLASLFSQFRQGKTQGDRKRAGDPLSSIVKKPREARGTKSLARRDEYNKAKSPQEKISLLEIIYDKNHHEYQNADRQWLIRAKKTLDCYTICAKKDLELFMLRNGKGNGAFKLGETHGCPLCSKK